MRLGTGEECLLRFHYEIEPKRKRKQKAKIRNYPAIQPPIVALIT